MTRLVTLALVASTSLLGNGHRLDAQDSKPADKPAKVILNHAAAADLVADLSPILKGKGLNVELVPEPLSNSIQVTAPANRRAHVLRLIAELDALSKQKQYVIEVRVCQGDPLGDQRDIDVLARPTLMVPDGQPGLVNIGRTLARLDPDTEDDFAGISLSCCARGVKDGNIRLEFSLRIAELVSETKDFREMRSWSARGRREVRHGETTRLRLKSASASDQTWVEATVREVAQGK